MTREELNQIAQKIQTDKTSVSMTKRDFVNALGCEKRTSGNVENINDFLKRNNLKTTPNYINGNIDEEMELSYIFRSNTDNFKLIYLYIDGYKNLEKLSIDFLDTSNYCTLIGLNGSGKSNIIEAISYIFYSLYQIATVGNKSQYQCPFNYKIVYSFDKRCIEIADGKNISKIDKVNIDVLPKNIIASYSGEDTRLWETSFKIIFDKYCGRIFAESAGFDPPFMFYISKRQWEIAMIALLYSDNVDVIKFVKSIIRDNEVIISFDIARSNTHRWEGTLTGAFIDEIRKSTSFTLKEFKDTVNNISFIEQPSTLFYLLYKASIKSDSTLISKINIKFLNGGDLESLSEGEKKLILTNLIIHVLSSKNSLCLFDEPDSHIHISRKKDLIGLIDEENRYSIVATHSPILTQAMNPKNIKYIKNGKIESLNGLEVISMLSGNTINYISGALILSSKTPLILVEGIGDVEYIKKAISALSKENAKYEKLDFDILQMGGGGKNSKYFTDNIRPHITSEKRVIVLFDRDDSGCEGMKECANITGGRRNFETYKKDNWYYLMLPKTNDHMEDDFLIEDYFSKEHKEKIASAKVLDAGGHFNKYPKDLRQLVKDTLKSELAGYDKTQLCGFSVLLDKLFDIINETEQCKIL